VETSKSPMVPHFRGGWAIYAMPRGCDGADSDRPDGTFVVYRVWLIPQRNFLVRSRL
jgi:hypothetical protein